MKNPWLKPAPAHYYPVTEVAPTGAEDRKKELKEFNPAKLKAVIAWPGTQKTVRIAAERQLKKLKNKF